MDQKNKKTTCELVLVIYFFTETSIIPVKGFEANPHY